MKKFNISFILLLCSILNANDIVLEKSTNKVTYVKKVQNGTYYTLKGYDFILFTKTSISTSFNLAYIYDEKIFAIGKPIKSLFQFNTTLKKIGVGS